MEYIFNRVIHNPPANEPDNIRNLKCDAKYEVGSIFCHDKCKNKIHILIIRPTKIKSDKYIIYAHGNAANISTLINLATKMVDETGYNVVLFDYNGYGYSTGTLSEEHCYASLETTVAYVIGIKGNKDGILLIGRSLGTGVVVNYVAKYQWYSPIVVISPYKSILSIAIENYNDKYDKFVTIKKIECVNIPVKIYHGYCDELIPISHAKEIYNRLNDKSIPPTYLSNTCHIDIIHKIDLTELKDLI